VRLVFFGTPETAAVSLRALVAAGHRIVLVVTQPDRPSGRSREPMAPPSKLAALEAGIEVSQPVRLRTEEFLGALRVHSPELLVVVAYGRILKPELLAIAPRGAINLHFSLLPRYRGAAPVQWALANGEMTTGVTTLCINERLDEGELLLQRQVAIEPGEHAPALQSRLAEIGATLLVETLQQLERGMLEPRPQDHRLASLAPRLTARDGEIDLRLDAREIEGRIRGFDPWPGVWARRNGQRLRLAAGRAVEVRSAEPPGTIIALGHEAVGLVCGGGTIVELRAVQAEGRRIATVQEALHGRQIRPGELLA
jgi:methionyl-tRNA formyltransferase